MDRVELGRGDLVIATYNIHRCVGTDRQLSPERIADVLREIDADIVALQEVDSALPEHGIDQLAFLAKALGYQGLAGPTIIRHRGEYGNAILSRWPLQGVERVDLSIQGREPRGFVATDVRLAEGTLRFVATHFGLRRSERRAQSRRLLQAVGDRRGPLALLGDINEWVPRGLDNLDARFGPATLRRSFPSMMPVLALDRVWVQPNTAVLDVEPHRTPLSRVASDHLPVRARLDRRSLFAAW